MGKASRAKRGRQSLGQKSSGAQRREFHHATHHGGPLAELRHWKETDDRVRYTLDEQWFEIVTEARALKIAWNDIGPALGVSAQAAFRKFERVRARRNREG